LTEPPAGPLKRTPLYALHRELGARIVPFAGYEMPVQYPTGILAEHAQTRSAAGLFDVSHMGQVRLTARPGQAAAKALESLVPADIAGLEPGQQRYTQFTNEGGGILDDLMVTSTGDHLLLVVNAACKDADLAHLQKHLAAACEIEPMFSRGLLALQARWPCRRWRARPQVAGLKFMTGACRDRRRALLRHAFRLYRLRRLRDFDAGRCRRSHRPQASGPAGVKPTAWRPRSLRLEAGLCLRQPDIDTTTTPIEAVLLWSIGKERRAPRLSGAAIVQKQIADGAPRKRVGFCPKAGDRREGARRRKPSAGSRGGFAPTLGRHRHGLPPSFPPQPTAPRSSPCAATCAAEIVPMPSSNTPLADRALASVKYSQEHERISVEGDVGAIESPVCPGAVGRRRVRRVPKAGRKVAKGDACAGRPVAASDIYSPVLAR
jgi:aminomethyltransferase